MLQGGSAEVREAAAAGLGELVEVTGTDSLKPFVIQITGPLIRIIGDKFAWQVGLHAAVKPLLINGLTVDTPVKTLKPQNLSI